MSVLEKISNIVGAKNLRIETENKTSFLVERRGMWEGEALAVVLPQNIKEVISIVKLVTQEGLHIVPQGGNTGLVGSQIAFDKEKALVVNFSRMNKIREIDKASGQIIVETGCVLADIHKTAENINWQFPLRLASEGSAQLGGLLASNAGGHHVLRYGMMRDLTLGLEAVFANGEVFNGLSIIRKDNSGYDLKNLLIGSEGTLALITAAVLQLYPKDRKTATAMVALDDIEKAISLFGLAQNLAAGQLSAFELMPHIGVEFITHHFKNARQPFLKKYNWYVLIECANPNTLEDILENQNAIIAQSNAQTQAFWFIRENLSEVQKKEGASIKHDISVPLSQWAKFTKTALEQVEKAVPNIRAFIFGHLGDGNLHFNLQQPIAMHKEDFLSKQAKLNEIIYDLVLKHQGSISAEHGIGILKRKQLEKQKGKATINAMRAIKQSLDPKGIFNPNKIFEK